VASPLTACRFWPRLETASGPALEAEELFALDEFEEDALLGRPGVVTPVSGLGSGGLPKGPDPAGGFPG